MKVGRTASSCAVNCCHIGCRAPPPQAANDASRTAATPQRAHAPLIALAQRLPSAFAIRVIDEPVDLTYPSAFVAGDTGGWYFRPLGHRLDGETRLDGPARMRQLKTVFDGAWERARPATELRALGI